MRADRLLSILMLLQTRGQMTAAELAMELEVSERTIYRDIEALSISGIPIYAERGPGGGCGLLDHYRMHLTGLKQEEIQALFMLSIPAPLDELGVGQELRQALLKFTTALPLRHHGDEQYVRQRIYLDSTGWTQTSEKLPHLKIIHQAIWENKALQLTYQLPFDTEVTCQINPYSLVAKTNIWYLIYERDTHFFVMRVDQITNATLIEQSFLRSLDFDLGKFWKKWCAGIEKHQPHYTVSVRIVPELKSYIAPFISQQLEADEEGWLNFDLSFESFEVARMHLLSWGCAVEVLKPRPLRLSLLDFATQIVDFYSHQDKL